VASSETLKLFKDIMTYLDRLDVCAPAS
jgi:hypothetical protein